MAIRKSPPSLTMGIFGRLILILKGYVGAAGDRVERVAVEEELRLARARKEALEELRSVDASVGVAPVEVTGPAVSRPAAKTLAADYRLLGMAPGAGLESVEAAWRELARRADPKRFPADSEEEKRAAEILKSLNEAYARIRESVNPTEGRFGRLEL